MILKLLSFMTLRNNVLNVGTHRRIVSQIITSKISRANASLQPDDSNGKFTGPTNETSISSSILSAPSLNGVLMIIVFPSRYLEVIGLSVPYS
jgi:hypothetical protein